MSSEYIMHKYNSEAIDYQPHLHTLFDQISKVNTLKNKLS